MINSNNPAEVLRASREQPGLKISDRSRRGREVFL